MPRKKKKYWGLTIETWTIIGALVGILALALVFKNEILALISCQKTVKSSSSDSSFVYYKDETPSKTDTLVVIHQEEKPTDTFRNVEDKPADSTCVVVYLKGDPRSEKDAHTVANQLKKIIEEDFVALPKDAFWFKMNFPVNPEAIDTGSNVLVWISDNENRELGNQVYICVSHSRYVLDSSVGRWVRAETLPFNKASSEVVFADVQPEMLVQGKFGLHKYPVAVIIPPYPFYKQAHLSP